MPENDKLGEVSNKPGINFVPMIIFLNSEPWTIVYRFCDNLLRKLIDWWKYLFLFTDLYWSITYERTRKIMIGEKRT